MDTSKFETAWDEQIKPALSELEDERRKAQKQRLWMGVAAFCLMLAGVLGEFEVGLWFFLPIGLLIGCIFPISYYRNSYSKDFKKRIFQSVAAVSDLDWRINPRNEKRNLFADSSDSQSQSDADVGKTVLADSKLFADYSSVDVDDILVGESSDTTMPAWEMDVIKGHGRSAYTVFSGFLVRITVDDRFRGETYIRTKTDNRSDIGEDDWLGFGNLQEIQLEWSDFEEFLVVESSDPTEAREILTPDFMEALYHWWQDNNKNYRFGFREDKIYIAFPAMEDLEPRAFTTVDAQKDDVREVFSFIHFIEESVKLVSEKRG